MDETDLGGPRPHRSRKGPLQWYSGRCSAQRPRCFHPPSTAAHFGPNTGEASTILPLGPFMKGSREGGIFSATRRGTGGGVYGTDFHAQGARACVWGRGLRAAVIHAPMNTSARMARLGERWGGGKQRARPLDVEGSICRGNRRGKGVHK